MTFGPRETVADPLAGVSRRERAVFEQIAIGQDVGHHKKTLAALLARGYIVETVQGMGRDRFGVIAVSRYHVPFSLHYAWCSWCSQQGGNDD